jgi:hypothetical protein
MDALMVWFPSDTIGGVIKQDNKKLISTSLNIENKLPVHSSPEIFKKKYLQ